MLVGADGLFKSVLITLLLGIIMNLQLDGFGVLTGGKPTHQYAGQIYFNYL